MENVLSVTINEAGAYFIGSNRNQAIFNAGDIIEFKRDQEGRLNVFLNSEKMMFMHPSDTGISRA